MTNPPVPLSVLSIAVDCRREGTAPREYVLETQEERLVQRPKHIFEFCVGVNPQCLPRIRACSSGGFDSF